MHSTVKLTFIKNHVQLLTDHNMPERILYALDIKSRKLFAWSATLQDMKLQTVENHKSMIQVWKATPK